MLQVSHQQNLDLLLSIYVAMDLILIVSYIDRVDKYYQYEIMKAGHLNVLWTLWCRLGESVADITLVDSSSLDVWRIWSTISARKQRLDDDALLLYDLVFFCRTLLFVFYGSFIKCSVRIVVVSS